MTPAPSAVTGLPQQGDVIAGKYQVEEVLGQGGMGVVVAARHLALRQRVAVKFLLPAGLRLPGARERFLREAQAAAALQSEHVARVLDVGTLETGAPYLVMEYLSGTDLSHLLKTRGSLPIAEAVDLLLQACEAIGEAHALGIVHRDLKPQNLFVVTRGGARFIKVLDFGLSKMSPAVGGAPEASLTATDVVMGSPQYMSPEHIRSLKYVDARSDIWALGVILYQLVTGRRPFVGDSMIATCASIVADTPRPPSSYRRDVPASLDVLVQRCLEKDPARRIQTVAELMQGLLSLAPTRTHLSAELLEQAQAHTPGKSSQASISAIVAPIAGSTTPQFQTTSRLRAGPQKPSRPRKIALFAAAFALVVVGIFASSVMIWLQWSKGEAAIDDRSPESASTAVAAPAPPPTPAEEKKAEPFSAESIKAVPPAPPLAPTSAVSATASSPSLRPPPREASTAAATSAKASPPPPPATAAPAATAKPDAGQAPKPKTTKDLMDRYD